MRPVPEGRVRALPQLAPVHLRGLGWVSTLKLLASLRSWEIVRGGPGVPNGDETLSTDHVSVVVCRL